MSRPRPERERAIAADLAAIQTRLARQGLRRALPLLDGLRIASPCEQSWDEMQPGDDDRSRHCLACRKSVYDISSMTAEEAEEFLSARLDPCVQIFRRADGTIITRQDCSVGASRVRVRRSALAVAAAGASVLCAVAVASFAEEPMSVHAPSSYRAKAPVEELMPESAAPTIGTRPVPLRGAPPPARPVLKGHDE